jgi:hypothetical protein
MTQPDPLPADTDAEDPGTAGQSLGADPSNTPVEQLTTDTDPDDDGPDILRAAYDTGQQ